MRKKILCTGGHVKPKRGRRFVHEQEKTSLPVTLTKKEQTNNQVVDTDVLAAKFLAKFSCVAVVPPPSGPPGAVLEDAQQKFFSMVNPSRVYQREIVTVVKETYDHETLCIALRAHIVYWVWLAQNRQSRFLLSEALSLLTAVHAPFNCIQDTFDAYCLATSLSASSSTSSSSPSTLPLLMCPTLNLHDAGWWQRIAGHTNRDCVAQLPPTLREIWERDAHGWAIVVRNCYFGRDFFLTNKVCQDMWISKEELHMFGDDPTLTGKLEHRLFQSPYTQVFPYVARCTVRPQRKRHSFHQGHLSDAMGSSSSGNAGEKGGIASLCSSINLTDMKIYGKDRTPVTDGCDMRITKWQSECGGYFQMVLYLLPNKKPPPPTTLKKSTNCRKRQHGTVTNARSSSSGGGAIGGTATATGGVIGGSTSTSTTTTTSVVEEIQGLVNPSTSFDLDDFDLLLEEFSENSSSNVERFNASETPYVQDIEEIDRLWAETSNNIFTGGFMLESNTGEQRLRARSVSLSL